MNLTRLWFLRLLSFSYFCCLRSTHLVMAFVLVFKSTAERGEGQITAPLTYKLCLLSFLVWPKHFEQAEQLQEAKQSNTIRCSSSGMTNAIGPAARADFRRLYPANAKTPTCCPSDDKRTKVTNSVTSARSLWWHVGPYFWPADLTRTANPISSCRMYM